MDTYDRTLRTLKGFVAHATGLEPADEDSARAVEHAARVVHVLKELSTLCTHLNTEGSGAGAVCAFYTPERNEGLDDDKLFLTPPSSATQDLDDVPHRQYWGAYIRSVLKGVKTPRNLHEAAIELQMRAVRSMAACVAQHIRRDFASNCAALCMLDHLTALTGPPANSSVKHWKERTVADPATATSTDVRRAAESESMQVFDATLTHLMHFAGPVEDFVHAARRAFCVTLDAIPNSDARQVIEEAMRAAGDAGRRELLRCSHTVGRGDSVCDDVLFLRVSQLLGSFRQFIEYESLFDDEYADEE